MPFGGAVSGDAPESRQGTQHRSASPMPFGGAVSGDLKALREAAHEVGESPILFHTELDTKRVTNAFRRSGQRGRYGLKRVSTGAWRQSPMPFGGAVSGDEAASGVWLPITLPVSPMPFGGAVSGDVWGRRYYESTVLSPMPFGGAVSGDVVDRYRGEEDSPVTNAFRRSGQRGPPHPLRFPLRTRCHQCLSAERSAGTQVRSAKNLPASVTNAFRRSGQRGHRFATRKTCRPAARHQCLSAERSAGTKKLFNNLTESHGVTNAFRRSGQRGLAKTL